MAKPELGTKRTCQSCGSKYYDLMHDPIVCPKCGVTFVAVTLMSNAAVARAAKAEAIRNKAAAAEEDDEVVEKVEDVDAISLEDADEEATATEKVATSDEEEEEEDADGADETFLEPDEDSEDDVTDIIGDREKDDEA